MSTRRQDDPRSVEEKAEQRRHFMWQEMVAAHPGLTSHQKVVMWCLALSRNMKSGLCDPSIVGLAERAGVHKNTVLRALAAGERLGLYTVEDGGGRQVRNKYRFVLPDVNSPSIERPFTGAMQKETVSFESVNGLSIERPEHVEHTTETPTVSPWGERDGASRTPPPGPADAGPSVQKKEQAVAVLSKEQTAAAAGLEALHAVWKRGWSKDSSTRQRAADQQAFDEATRHAGVEDILAGAKAWVAAADAPRYLPVLSDWLAARGWEKPPPKKQKPRAGNGHSRRRYGKLDVAKIMLKQEAGWLEDADGNLMNPETGRIWRNTQ